MTSRQTDPTATRTGRPVLVTVIALIVALAALFVLVQGALLATGVESDLLLLPAGEEVAGEEAGNGLLTLLATLLVAGLGLAIAWGLWRLKNWARTALVLLLALGGLYYGVTIVFDAAGQIFGGEQVVAMGEILRITAISVGRILATGAIPVGIIYILSRLEPRFEDNPGQRQFVDKSMRYVLLVTALSAAFIVFLIILFTLIEAWPSIAEIGLGDMLLGTIWRPGSIIGTEDAQFGLVPMIVGSILATFGSVVLGVPLSVLTAILLAEVAPVAVREVLRPAVELLAGIPSVVYGLFGMVVLAPLIRNIEVPYNTGFNILNASVILAVMIIPTVTNIAEDALRAVPKEYKNGSLALGTTHWQTIWGVMLPAARSGIIAAVILGIGRALGETMAMIMVIGNSIAIPTPLNDNPLTLFLSSARTLTGNIAVEINYAAGAHRAALFFTGVLLFAMIFLVNSLARYLMRERLQS